MSPFEDDDDDAATPPSEAKSDAKPKAQGPAFDPDAT